MHGWRPRFVASAIILVVLLAACGNASKDQSGGGGGGGREGVANGQIKVGGVVGKTNPTGLAYDEAYFGAQAYFEDVHPEIYGLKFNLIPPKDDQTRASLNAQLIQQTVEQDKVFAVLPVVTNVFTGAKYVQENNIPTFGWTIQKEWGEGLSTFGQRGSFLCLDCPDVALAWFAKKVAPGGNPKVAILGYSAAQAAACADGQKKSMDAYGIPVAYMNKALAFGFTDISADAQKIRDAGANVLLTCVDVNGNIKIARALKGTNIAILSPEGYDPAVPQQFGPDVEGMYFRTVFVPFEAADADSPGLTAFLESMRKRNRPPTERLLSGWLNAALLYRGLQDAGEDFTRQKVIDSINKIKDWTADGILAPVDWTLYKDGVRIDVPDGTEVCNAWLIVRESKFTPTFGEPGKPFVCQPKMGDVNQTQIKGMQDLTGK